MGITAENVAKQVRDQTASTQGRLCVRLAAKSAPRSALAEAKVFADEIVPVAWPSATTMVTRKTFDLPTPTSCRAPHTTLEGLAKLRPAFCPERLVSPPAAHRHSVRRRRSSALVMTKAKRADELGVEPARVLPRTSPVAGVDPAIMGIGPIPAVKKLLERRPACR